MHVPVAVAATHPNITPHRTLHSYRNCTGVDPDIAYSVVPRLFEAGDFAVGSKLRFHHAPHQE